jgi:hypothetical protein
MNMPCIRARIQRLRKNSCFVSGHDFSRAAQSQKDLGFSPWFLLMAVFLSRQAKHAGAKSPSFFYAFTARLKSCPDTRHEFCATSKFVP